MMQKIREMQQVQPTKLKLILQLFIHIITSISTRLSSLLIFISFFSLLFIWLNPTTKSIHSRIVNQTNQHATNYYQSIQKPVTWNFTLNKLFKIFTCHTTTTFPITESHRFKPSRFSEPTSAQTLISSKCAEEWISSGIRCQHLFNMRPQSIDLLWTWVNDSVTPELQLSSKSQRGSRIINQVNSHSSYLYRQHDELKFSLRSSLESLPDQFINSRFILTADKYVFINKSTLPPIKQHWISRPNWLISDHASLDLPIHHHRIYLKHHSEIFQFKSPSPMGIDKSDWLKNYVPSHNSLAIESQFGHFTGINNNFIYLNDDCFFINKFGEGDFSSEIFGPVFRIQFDLNVEEDTIDRSGTVDAKGEWPSLAYSNFLLNRRFGSRTRRYISHVAKVSQIQIMREVSEIWEDEIFLTASSSFRGQRREINMMFLTTWYQIEKHREAMLHSFLMLKSDSNQDGIISDYEWDEMMKDIYGKHFKEDNSAILKVYQPFRPRRESIEKILGDYGPIQTDYQWLSSDGYPLIKPEIESIPNYQIKEEDGPRTVICELNVTKCFPNDYRRSDALMKWVAFEKPECGDCLISLLIGKQATGMESLLPPASVRTKIAKFLDQPVYRNSFSTPHKTSSQLIFYSDRRASSSRFLSGSFLIDDPRIWAIRNLQRYQYVLGNTPSEFQSLTTIHSSRKILYSLEKKFNNKVKQNQDEKQKKKTNQRKLLFDGLLVTINDRIVPFQFSTVQSIFKNWLQSSWPIPAPWEKT